MKLKVVLEPAEEDGFTAHVFSLPGCVSEGETKEETLKKKNIKGTIPLYLESVDDDRGLSEKAQVLEVSL